MSVIKFTGSLLEGSGKSGILVPDSDGYREVMLGGLNTYSRSGELYTAEDVLHLFNSSSVLMRRLKGNCVYSEVGHPKYVSGMTEAQYYQRLATTEESNVCGHISEIYLDLDYGKKHAGEVPSDCIGVIGKVIPSGPKADALERAFNNPKQNCSFSVRGIKDVLELSNGKKIAYLRSIVTYDWVGEGGIPMADRHRAPSLESYTPDLDVMINRDSLERMLSDVPSRLALESNDKFLFEEIKESISRTKEKARKAVTIFDWLK